MLPHSGVAYVAGWAHAAGGAEPRSRGANPLLNVVHFGDVPGEFELALEDRAGLRERRLRNGRHGLVRGDFHHLLPDGYRTKPSILFYVNDPRGPSASHPQRNRSAQSGPHLSSR